MQGTQEAVDFLQNFAKAMQVPYIEGHLTSKKSEATCTRNYSTLERTLAAVKAERLKQLWYHEPTRSVVMGTMSNNRYSILYTEFRAKISLIRKVFS